MMKNISQNLWFLRYVFRDINFQTRLLFRGIMEGHSKGQERDMEAHPFIVKIEGDIEAVTIIEVPAKANETLLVSLCSKLFLDPESIVVVLFSGKGEHRVASLDELKTLYNQIEIAAVVGIPHSIVKKHFPPNG